MSKKTYVIVTCAHATPEATNERFNWLGEFLYDLGADVFVDLGDRADMSSLNSYDTRYPKAIVAQSYEADIQSYLDSQERLWWKFRHNKRKMPYRVGLEGNHENRIKKAIAQDPRLEGKNFGISFSHLDTKYFYNEYVEYENSGPGIINLDGVDYSHFFSAGNYGKPIAGTHHAFALLQHRHTSSTCGHSHKRGLYFKDGVRSKGIIGLVAGCFKGKEEKWAGQSQKDWWKGLVVCREVENGFYDPEFVSMDRLKREYSK